MTDAIKTTPPEVSPEFFIRVNDFIGMANRIERRFDSHHAHMAMLNAFARYSAHHYGKVVVGDVAQNRESFVAYCADAVRSLVISHLEELSGPLAPEVDSNDAAAE